MCALSRMFDELVTANRILAHEEVVDAFGHVSIRHPDRPDRYVLSRARAPECVEVDDLMEFTLDGTPIDPAGRTPYAERFIHGAVYEARAGVRAVVHHHSPSVIPFSVTTAQLSPIMHMCAGIGARVPTWDSRMAFGDTNLLVTTMAMARDLAAALSDRTVVLMRGHGAVVAGASLREVVFNAIYLQVNANLQMNARALGNPTCLSNGEIAAVLRTRGSFTFERAWEYWCRRAGRPYDERPLEGSLAGL
ncbi:MAG TPA: class II aldolase/adducin family protein [Vicinamibacterales bacterium]|nr:class II aldolase/adducin family protein [Vicinamibacterales bacterium]